MGSLCSSAPSKPMTPAPHVHVQIKEPVSGGDKNRKQKPSIVGAPVHSAIIPPEKVEEKPSLPKEFQCEKGHELVWHNDITFKYDSINGTWFIRCDTCNNVYSTSGYHCDQCNFNMCDICCKSFKKERQVLYCEAKHELIWTPELVYKRKTENADLFACNLCAKTKREPAWSCETCEYDVCLMCAMQAGIPSPQDFILCETNSHPLDYLEKAPDEDHGHQCNLCQAEIASHYGRLRCDFHDYDVCIDCADKKLLELVPHPGFKCKCSEEKRLRIQNRKKLSEDTGDEYSCQVCSNTEFEYAYICEDCLLCYCLNCSSLIHRKILNSHTKTCSNGHRLMWRHCSLRESKTFICEGCKTKRSCGVFLCADCNYHECISCFKI